MTTPSGRAIPPRRGNAAAASARTKTDGRTRPSSTSGRPVGKGRAAYAGEISVLPRRVLPAAATEEAEERENEDHDEDDPGMLTAYPPFRSLARSESPPRKEGTAERLPGLRE